MIVKTKLSEIHDAFSDRFETVSLRGEGSAAFLYVSSKGRAVEISEDSNCLWLEFWDNSDDDDASPMKESTFGTPAEAIRAVKQWLK